MTQPHQFNGLPRTSGNPNPTGSGAPRCGWALYIAGHVAYFGGAILYVIFLFAAVEAMTK